jgi:hypothetical protein
MLLYLLVKVSSGKFLCADIAAPLIVKLMPDSSKTYCAVI